jgi:paraquat-inducible protein A
MQSTQQPSIAAVANTSAPSAGVTVCRRCGKGYAIPPRLALASCPHCGAAARPLLWKLRDNRLAATLALAALGVLSAGVVLPSLSLSQMGDVRIFSILTGIRELYASGHILLADIILVFSVVFPYAKLLAILVATTRLLPLSAGARRRLHHLANVTARYSLLDVLVIAILVVVVKFDGLAEARALPGTYCFAAAVFLSIGAGLCVNLDHLRQRECGAEHE